MAESDLSLALSQVLHRFAQLSENERSIHEKQAKMDVVRLLNVADEQLRLIGSVRVSDLAPSEFRCDFAEILAWSSRRPFPLESGHTLRGRMPRVKPDAYGCKRIVNAPKRVASTPRMIPTGMIHQT